MQRRGRCRTTAKEAQPMSANGRRAVTWVVFFLQLFVATRCHRDSHAPHAPCTAAAADRTRRGPRQHALRYDGARERGRCLLSPPPSPRARAPRARGPPFRAPPAARRARARRPSRLPEPRRKAHLPLFAPPSGRRGPWSPPAPLPRARRARVHVHSSRVPQFCAASPQRPPSPRHHFRVPPLPPSPRRNATRAIRHDRGARVDVDAGGGAAPLRPSSRPPSRSPRPERAR